MKTISQTFSQSYLDCRKLTILGWYWSFLFIFLTSHFAMAQVNTGGSATVANHNKQIIGYITNWDAWKAASAGVPSAGALTQLNIDYSKYTILNYSFFGVAVDGSLHSGDLRNKNIYQEGVVQEPADLLYGDPYSSWDFHILFGEIENVNYISPEVKERAEALGYEVAVGGSTWTHPEWGLSGALPLPLPMEGSGAKGLLELAHQSGVKVMASIGGWSMCKHFPEMAADATKRARFIEDCKKLINMGFDGIDLDWEYPGPFPGMNFTGTNADYANFENLVQEIRNAIGPDKLITAAMAADYKKLEGFNWSKLASTMDYFNMMTYDFNGGFSNIAGHNAPLYPYEGAEAPDFNWQTLLTKMKGMGVPANKINFGAPFYGRGVVTDGAAEINVPTVKRPVTIQPDGPIQTAADYTNWPQDVYDGTPNYFFIKQKTGAGSGWTRKWDDQAKVPYMIKDNFFLSYDDEESIAEKAKFINENNLAGTIIWTVFGDLEFSGTAQSFGTKLKRWSTVKSPLVNKINEVFAAGDTGGGGSNQNPTVSIDSPEDGTSFEAGTSITISSSAEDSDGTVAKVEFYNGGTLLGSKTTSPFTYTWNEVPEGNYVLSVKATDNEGGTATDSVTITVTGTGGGGGSGNCNAPAWQSGRPYVGGEEVSYEGREYKAKWWTVQVPAGSSEWEDLGPCEGGGGGGQAPQVNITSPASGSTFDVGSSVTIIANATDTDGSITKVEFYNGTTYLGEDTTAPYSFEISSLEEGNYSFTAKAFDNDSKTSSSSAVSVRAGTSGGDCESPNGFKVVGYFPTWQGNVSAIQFDKLTHINYSFILPNSDGSLRPLENASKLQELVTQGQAQGTKILIAVGGWMDGNDSAFTQLAANPSTRTSFIDNLIAFVDQYNLDGVDMDWEYPREGDEPQNFELLMQELGQALHSRGKLLTSAVVVSGWNADGVLSGVFDDVDFLNIMAYDGPDHGSMAQATGGLDYWLGRGLPKEKAILGVPFYSRPQAQSYANLLAQGADPYADSFQGNNYNGITTIKEKTELAIERAGGIMIWEISHDTSDPSTSLLTAIHQVAGDPCGGGDTNQNPLVSLTSPVDNATFEVGETATLTANASDPDGSISKVEFFNGSQLLFSDSEAPYTYTWNNLAEGNFTLTATATDDKGSVATSAAIAITVSTSGGGSGGGNEDCTQSPYVEGGGYQEGSQVQNQGNVYECKPFPYSGWCNGAAWAYEPGVGSYWQDAWTLVGECSGGGGSGAPSVAITSPANNAKFTTGQSINIAVNASDTGGSISNVEFYANGTLIGEDNANPYNFNWTNPDVGSYTLTAIATDNENNSTTSESVVVTVSTSGGGGNSGDLEDKILVGYWHNFNNGSSTPKLSEVSTDWDVICVAFAEPTLGSRSNMTFSPYEIYGSASEFINDVKTVQDRGQKVLISIGGANAIVELNSTSEKNEFISSMTSIITTYGFDGLDIDLEGGSLALQGGDTDFRNPTTPKIVNLIDATKAVRANVGADNFILSMAPETLYVQGGFSSYGGASGAYLPVIYGLQNELDYIHVQHYNTGCMLGLDGLCYSSSTADFHVAMADMLLQGFPAGGNQFPALRPDQVAIGLPANTSAAGSGYTSVAEVHKALDYIIKGQSFGGSYQLRNPSGYPGFRGLMTWSINWDITTDFGFSKPHRAYLDGLTNRIKDTDIVDDIKIYPNPFREELSLTYQLKKSAKVSVSIYNQLGAKVQEIVPDTEGKIGTQEIRWEARDLPTGFYYLKFRTGTTTKTFKLVKQ